MSPKGDPWVTAFHDPAGGRGTLGRPGGEVSQLRDVVEEAEYAFREQRRGVLVIVGPAVVGEQVPIAGRLQQLCALNCLGEVAADVEILVGSWDVIHDLMT
jgi:hypothetical protein